MTTPQKQPVPAESTERTDSSTQNADAGRAAGSATDASDTPQPAGERTDSAGSTPQSSPQGSESTARHADSSPGEALFAEHDLSSLRSRWADIQAAFVDDPQECVEKADSLVADVVARLTAGFAEARSRLEDQWGRGEDVSTENLRVALKRYRDVFERLLAV